MESGAEEPGRVTRSMARRQKQNTDHNQDASTNSMSHHSDSDEGSPGQQVTNPDPAPGDAADQVLGLQPSGNELSTKTAISLLLLIFCSSLLAMGLVWKTFPDMNPEDQESIKFPKDLDDAKKLGQVLSRYKEQYFAQVFAGFVCVYIFLQTFAIPGSIFLSIISGFLFPFPLALFAVCFCSATGASFCYLLSYLVGRKLVRHYLPDRAAQWSAKVDSHRSNLLSYILFLRITPFLPNWFINIVSPVIGVPLLPFWMGTFFGVAPPSFIFIQAGTTLQQLSSTMDPITVETVLLLVVFALLSLVPVLLKNKLKTKFE